MASINLYLRDKNSTSSTPIILFLHYNRVRYKFSTNETIQPKFWDDKKQRAKSGLIGHAEFNRKLVNIRTTAENLLREYQNENNLESPSPERFRTLLNEKLFPETTKNEFGTSDLFSFCESYLNEYETRLNTKTGKPISPNTLRVYKQAYRELQGFRSKYYKNRPFSFEQIDYYFYTQFQRYLITDRLYSTNTVGKHIKTLKSFFLEAHARGLMPNFISSKFKSISEKTDTIYLTVEELDTLYNLDLSNNPRLDKVRDLFLVGAWTGLRFSDYSDIKPENIKDGFIELTTKKTNSEVVIPIHTHVEAIMRKYRGITPNSLPNPISNQKMNEYLKEIGALAELDERTAITYTKGGKTITANYPKYELLSTHTARRSFATNQYLLGVPTITIMKLTSHQTEKAFMKYIRVTPKEHAQKLKELWLGQNPKMKIV
jgi:integrase